MIETARLILRDEWREADRAPMAAINADPEVGRYLNWPPTPEFIANFHDALIAHWAEFGYGPYAVEEKATGTLLGFAGLANPPMEMIDEPELGWRLGPAAWGKGYATEAARAIKDHVCGVLGHDHVIAVIHPLNVRSHRVAEKLGMTRHHTVWNHFIELEVDVWRAECSD